MNSALQCLSNVPSLTEYFLCDEYKEHINRDNPLGMRGDIAQAYGELIHEMWSGRNSSYAPKTLKNSVSHYAPQFDGYQQYDSQEFMSFLLDGLQEDLNLVKQKPYVDKKDDDGKAADATLAAEQWEYYQQRNQSKIHDIFHGQIKSVVQCLTCRTKERTFEPVCVLSLPFIRKTNVRTFKIEYVRLNGQIKSYSIKSDEHGHMSNLVNEFCDRFQPNDKRRSKTVPMDTDDVSSTDEADEEEEEEQEDFTKHLNYDGHQPKPDFILTTEVYNHRIHLQYSDHSSLTNIIDRDQIVFYEVPDSLKKRNSQNILMPCVFREESNRQTFGYPIYLSIPRHDCKGKDIQEALQVTNIAPNIFLSNLLYSVENHW
jgi:ubiquitin carboxyl-terminal hydrolase 4/11/15